MEKISKTLKKKQPKFTRPSVALKHKKVLDNLGENGGSMRQAIVDAGYSQKVADNPSKITSSVTWGELMEVHLSDDDLSQKHKELIQASTLQSMKFDIDIEPDEIREYFAEMKGYKLFRIVDKYYKDKGKEDEMYERIAYYRAPDTTIQEKALDKAYKLKGRYVDDTIPPLRMGNTYNFVFSAPVQEKIKAIEAEIKDMLTKPPQQ